MTLTALVRELTRPDRAIVLIDGGSGAGKTSLAEELAGVWPRPLTVVSMDAFYPGWHGLAAASDAVVSQVLRPERPGYRRWDWDAHRPAQWVPIDPHIDLIVEGCGALTPASRALATAALWLDMPQDERRRHALERDGDTFEPWWDAWEAQEREHWDRHRPWELADHRIGHNGRRAEGLKPP